MIYRSLDGNKDYTFGGNKQNFLSDAEAVAQAVKTRLKNLKYEWWEDLEDGLPLWQNIIANRDIKAAEQLILNRIQTTLHVRTVQILESFFNNDTRVYTFNAVLDTDFGSVVISEEVD